MPRVLGQLIFSVICATASLNANALQLAGQPAYASGALGETADASVLDFADLFAQPVSLPADASLTSVTWWGFHTSNSSGAAFDAFDVYLGSQPLAGSLVAQPAVPGALEVTRYTWTLTTPYATSTPTATTLTVVNDSPDVEWFWQYAAAPNPSGYAADQRAFSLEGTITAVPEPDTAMMFCAGACVLVAAWRNKRPQAAGPAA